MKVFWYALRTNSRSEKQVHERLQKQGYESFLPLMTTIKQWSDRKKKVVVPLISSYVFLQGTPKDLLNVVKIQGVVGVLRYLGKPAIVQEDEINNLKILTKNSEGAKKITPRSLANYAAVEVVDGPFKGLKGVYMATSGKQKVIVQVDVLNSFTEVTLPFEHIKEIVV
ncbi:UpxY family transcription antiterminator [Polaribacter litorisediminis]|uniref:UpxY family transcription antiterminator n=1 Tax=Polaribacter litorisediminis TaxID=1908341 RepID=UPI001CBF19E0|nr:UpxY family transcription antiterminator [Polaribacter litorisediminis]